MAILMRSVLTWAVAALLTFIVVACQENPAEVVVTVYDTIPGDTVRAVDTVEVYIWCKKVGWRNGQAWYRCNNGYEGPMF